LAAALRLGAAFRFGALRAVLARFAATRFAGRRFFAARFAAGRFRAFFLADPRRALDRLAAEREDLRFVAMSAAPER
jgi:hypothetical protein